MCVFYLEEKQTRAEPGWDMVPVYVCSAVAIITILMLSLCVWAVLKVWVCSWSPTQYTVQCAHALRYTTKREGSFTPNCASFAGDQDKWRSWTLSPPCFPEIQWQRPKKTTDPAPSLLSKGPTHRCYFSNWTLIFQGFWLKNHTMKLLKMPQSHQLIVNDC